jgi:cytochrome c biogenesis protein CcdA
VRPGGAAAFPLGMAFAAGWTPCIGPMLAGTLAAIGLLLVTGAWVRVMSPLLRLVNSFEPPI